MQRRPARGDLHSFKTARSCFALALFLASAWAGALHARGADPGREASAAPALPSVVKEAFGRFRPAAMAAHDKFLASDLLEGRGPGTRGGSLAIEYIAAQLAAAGLEPGGDQGTFFQKIALIGSTLDAPKSSLSLVPQTGSSTGPLKYLDEFVATNPSQTDTSTLDSEIIFVGHGAIAPEYQWDDYKGVDVRNKTLLMLVDDPPATSQEPDLFKGKARTYYGRWTYKFEMGTGMAAQAVLLIHTDAAAGYPWSVVRNSWGGESAAVRRTEGTPALACAGWITERVAAELCRKAGLDLGELTKAAASRQFRPVALPVRLRGHLHSNLRTFETANVIGRLPGADSSLAREAVLYTAHHDHLGVGEPDETGDRIYHGAIDNASGCAILLEMARVWAETKPAPKRSLIFNAVAAEEQGLLGSAYFGQHPTLPAGRIALALNYDAIPQLGRVRDVTLLGVERTTFLATAQRITQSLQLAIVPDPQPEQGHYYRSDHFSLAKVGIPAFSIDPGLDVIGKPAGWGQTQSDAYRERQYHQPGDRFDPKWDWSEGVQMAELGFWLGWDAANASEMPMWLPGDEFRPAREKSLEALGR
ncbi:MAG: M28 family peptidase [Verrucomicrobiota bacterium]